MMTAWWLNSDPHLHSRHSALILIHKIDGTRGLDITQLFEFGLEGFYNGLLKQN